MGQKSYGLENEPDDQIDFKSLIQAFKVDFFQGFNEKNKLKAKDD